MRHTIVLDSPRLIFEVPMPEDSDFLFLLNSNPDVVRYTGEQPWTMQNVVDFLTDNPGYEQYGWGRYILLLKGSNIPAGFAGFRRYDGSDRVFLSCRFLPDYWNKGYATEACKALLGYGFSEFSFPAIHAHIHPCNKASIRLAEKIGMKQSGAEEWNGSPWLVMRKGRY